MAQNQLPPRTADQVIAFSAGPTGGTVGLDTGTDLLEQTLTLPTNITAPFSTSLPKASPTTNSGTPASPPPLAGELESCSNTAFRESEITIDGTPAGVAPVYPWIYTGGIDPFLWIPIPGVQTLNFQPYRVNLTPFASLLDNGQPHTIALSVFNANNYFSATASLLLYLDSSATQFTGAVTENTLAVPVPSIFENISIAKNGNLQGTVNVKSGHNFKISGYINAPPAPSPPRSPKTSTSPVSSTSRLRPTEYTQNINQNSTVYSNVTTNAPGNTYVTVVNRNWPLLLNITVLVAPDGSLDPDHHQQPVPRNRRGVPAQRKGHHLEPGSKPRHHHRHARTSIPAETSLATPISPARKTSSKPTPPDTATAATLPPPPMYWHPSPTAKAAHRRDNVGGLEEPRLLAQRRGFAPSQCETDDAAVAQRWNRRARHVSSRC